jgi:hypothetical protein
MFKWKSAMCLAACSTAAGAADWVKIVTGADHGVAFIDLQSMQVEGSFRTAWVRWDRSEAESSIKEKDLIEVGCTRRTLRVLQWIQYNADGTVSDSGSNQGSVQQPEVVAPESTGESIVAALCGRK